MTQFVQCIDARDSDGALQHGAIYPVVAAYGRFIAVEAGPLKGWFRSRFKPAPSIDGLRAILQATPTKERENAKAEG